MTEFGHFASIGGGFCLDSWGAGPFVIKTSDRTSFRFEDSDRFGPSLVKSNGDISDTQPKERSPFWRAHRIWVRQGRRLEADGVTCMWDEPKPMVVYPISGRSSYIIENGEEDGRVITLPKTEENLARIQQKLHEDDGQPPATNSPASGSTPKGDGANS